MKWIDLSHRIKKNMTTYPSDPDVSIILEKSIQEGRSQLHSFSMGTHTGTHVDAASHIIEKGKSLDEYPISTFSGIAIKVDLNSFQSLKRINNIDGVILDTGWHQHFGDPEKYFSKDRPIISEALVDIVLERKVRFFGCDLPSVDESGSKKKPIHNKLLKSNIVIYESLANLNRVPLAIKINFYGFPLSLYGLDGSPVRAVCSF